MNTAIAQAKDPVLMAEAMRARCPGRAQRASSRAHAEAALRERVEPDDGSRGSGE